MRRTTGSILAAAVMLVGCGEITQPSGAPSAQQLSADMAQPQLSASAMPTVTGSGHLTRDLGGGPEMTSFSYTAGIGPDGAGRGRFQFNFRAADLKVHGSVTCVTTAGSIAWVGGVIDRLTSSDPADQALVGTDIWWRVVDNGEGDSAPDRTTSLLFTIATSPITAASWCADQPTRGIERPIEQGNIQIH